MMTGGWEKMSEREMMETWDAILAQDSHRSLASSKNLKQLGQPVSAETQVVAGSNYRFKFADGTIVPVFESLTHVFKIDDFKRATDVHYFSFNASAATNNGLILFLAVIGICMTLFYGVQYTRKLFEQDYTPMMEMEEEA